MEGERGRRLRLRDPRPRAPPGQRGARPQAHRGGWKERGDADSACEIGGLGRCRVSAARDRRGPVAVCRAIPAKVLTVEELGIAKEVQQLGYLTKGLVLVPGAPVSGKSTTLC